MFEKILFFKFWYSKLLFDPREDNDPLVEDQSVEDESEEEQLGFQQENEEVEVEDNLHEDW